MSLLVCGCVLLILSLFLGEMEMKETPGRVSEAEIIADLVKSASVVEIKKLRTKTYNLEQSVKSLKSDKQTLHDELITAKNHTSNVVVHLDKNGNFLRYDGPKDCNVKVQRQDTGKTEKDKSK